jgi:hypothetical protein
MSAFLSIRKNDTGDLATMVGGRPWSALRTPELLLNCCGPKDPPEARFCEFPVGGDVVNPRRLCSSRRDECSDEAG